MKKKEEKASEEVSVAAKEESESKPKQVDAPKKVDAEGETSAPSS